MRESIVVKWIFLNIILLILFIIISEQWANPITTPKWNIEKQKVEEPAHSNHSNQ
jgi:hypothetical protein